ncbi:Cloroperoxidase [Sistotremastrum niveocremeum HHB9708]|uniref:Cloroperoxidase n=1 Tax=Sistotremastrum niveocremeum HHB9708 TaxID=1314777 RepID=A0A164X0J8_9AGAM|nr:Cloroperoxidase [Sistotremastrum niveocremeum HHB9708]
MFSPVRTALVCLIASASLSSAFPTERSNPPGGVVITIPPRSTDVGLKLVPDADHPFVAPGPGDMRGPCPALNTLANHGYLPRNGVASYEQIINATREGFNMDHDLAAFDAAFAMLARGNAFVNRLSIGGETPLVPPLPGQIDGPGSPGGIAKHGRFEGDVSMTREDAALGDSVNFQDALYDELLLYTGKFGDDSPITGNRSIVTKKVMAEFKYARFVEDQARNNQLSFHAGRIATSYNEAAFILNLFANGTDGVLSIQMLGNIIRNQTFGANWFRRSSPGTFDLITTQAAEILAVHPVSPGANDENGNYIVDPPSTACNAAYYDLAVLSIPASYSKATGLFRKNVDTLLGAIAKPFGCPVIQPQGPVGV